MTERKARRAVDVEQQTTSNYPEMFKARLNGRVKRKLGDQFGLHQFGANLTELPPGAMSALRHWHTHEDEFVYILEGDVTLVTDAGDELLRPGDCMGFKAGVGDGHHLVNRSSRPVRYLEVGSRRPGSDEVFYPDDDIEVRPDGDTKRRFFRKDGTPY